MGLPCTVLGLGVLGRRGGPDWVSFYRLPLSAAILVLAASAAAPTGLSQGLKMQCVSQD